LVPSPDSGDDLVRIRGPGDPSTKQRCHDAYRGDPYPTLARFAELLSAPYDFEADFAFGLGALITGIERRLDLLQSPT